MVERRGVGELRAELRGENCAERIARRIAPELRGGARHAEEVDAEHEAHHVVVREGDGLREQVDELAALVNALID